MSEYQIVLASASPRRQELLSQIGLTFRVHPSRKEERVTKTQPKQVVQELSLQKAEDIFEQETAGKKAAPEGVRCPETEEKAPVESMPVLVIGADTIVACDGQILGKPKSCEDACRMLSMLQGRSHQVYTGVTVMWQMPDSGQKEQFTFYECTEVDFFPMSREEIEAYAQSGEPMDKAGAYGIQGRCARYIRGIRGDYNNVVGLPVGRLYQELHVRGLLG